MYNICTTGMAPDILSCNDAYCMRIIIANNNGDMIWPASHMHATSRAAPRALTCDAVYACSTSSNIGRKMDEELTA